MQAVKRKVTYLQALWPCTLVLVATLLILILWTALDPWKWEREFLSLVPPESLGKCTSDHFAGFFWSLTSILMSCTLGTLLMAWKTKTISQNLSDSSTVFYLIHTQMQAWFVGIPILAVIGDDSVDTVYFGRILLIFLFAMAPLFIVLLPRVSQAIKQKRNPELKRNHGNVHVSGITSQYPTNPQFGSSINNGQSMIEPSRPFQSSAPNSLLLNKSEEGPSTSFATSSLKMPGAGDESMKMTNTGKLDTIVSQHVLQIEGAEDKESVGSFME